jgi:hypothetical protein
LKGVCEHCLGQYRYFGSGRWEPDWREDIADDGGVHTGQLLKIEDELAQ